MRYAIGVDIGGGSTKIGLVSASGVIMRRTRLSARQGEDGGSIAKRLIAAIQPMVGAGDDVVGVGIGYPGPIHEDKLSGGIGNVPGLVDYPLAAHLAEALALPAQLENDATAAALAEVAFGAGQSSKRMLMITAGTGIGVAMIVDGAAMMTSGGCLGDAGHIIVDGASSLRCRLGCTGCLEALASAEALNDVATLEMEKSPDGAIARYAGRQGGSATAEAIVNCALGGDTTSQLLLATAGRWIGRAATSWIHTFSPDCLIIGGGLIAAGPLLMEPVEQEVRRCGLPSYVEKLRFARASLGNDAGIIGAAAKMLLVSRS